MLDLFPSREAGPFGRRLKRARGARIPVTVVTGFLGAGKTTLVRRFLATPEGAGTAVVINEFGSVGIDDALVRGSSDEVTLLGNGCLCCNTRSDLQVALRNLVAERAQGTVPQFQRILIETSGLADPGPILQTFATDRALGAEFHARAGVMMGATGVKLPARAPSPAMPPATIEVAVVGAHLSGMALNGELKALNGRLVRATTTAPDYRLYALRGTTPAKPGLLRVATDGGAAIEVEVWALSTAAFGAFVASVPPPMSIGTVRLGDGTAVKGFLVEAEAVSGAQDISDFGGWRAYVESRIGAAE